MTTTYTKKLPTIININLPGAIMRINTIVKGDDLLVDYINILNKKPFSQESLIFKEGQAPIFRLAQNIKAIRSSRLVEIFIFRISEFRWRKYNNIKENPFYVRKA